MSKPVLLKLFLVALGGAIGSLLRYGMSGWVQRLTSETFPVGTLAVNVLGCFLIGLLTAMLTGPVLLREEYRVGLTLGVLGGFTTFSSLGLESFSLANDGQWRLALANMTLSFALGLAAVWLGYRLSERWFGV